MRYLGLDIRVLRIYWELREMRNLQYLYPHNPAKFRGLHYEIIKHLDPVDSTCYGLAHRDIYSVHRKVHGSVHMWHKWRSGTFYYGQQDLFDRLKHWMKKDGYVWTHWTAKQNKRPPRNFQNGITKTWIKREALCPQELAILEKECSATPRKC